MRNWGGEFGEGKRAELRIERAWATGPGVVRPSRPPPLADMRDAAFMSPVVGGRSLSSAAAVAQPSVYPSARLPFSAAAAAPPSNPSLFVAVIYPSVRSRFPLSPPPNPPLVSRFCQIGVPGKIAMLLHEKGARDAKSAETARLNRCASVFCDIKAREERATRSIVRKQNNCEQAFLVMPMRAWRDLRWKLPK